MAIHFTQAEPKPKGRPKSAKPKVVLNIRVDADVLAKVKATGPGWQSLVNEALRTLASRL